MGAQSLPSLSRMLATWLVILVIAAVGLAVVMLGSAELVADAKEIDVSCEDGIDNDGDGVTDAEDPDCTVLSEEPVTAAPTEEPVTAAPTETVAPTAEPTATPTATPTDAPQPTAPPNTGGVPNQGNPDAAEEISAEFTAYLAESGIIGVLTSFLVFLLTIAGITWNAKLKRLAVTAIGFSVAFIYIGTRDGVEVMSLADVGGILFTVMITSQMAYTAAFDSLQQRFMPVRQE